MRDEYDFTKMKKRPGKVRVIPDASKVPLSIRLEAATLTKLRIEAERLGIPYQTLLNSVLHRYVTGELIDKRSAENLDKSKDR
jgi:predicted DNA binding CopG/RHH family protein